MTLPSCFNILNLDYFENILLQVDAVSTPEELQALINTVYADISLLESVMTGQIELLAPLAVLVEIPTDLGGLISWVTGFINNFIVPYIKPLTTMAAQIVLINAQVVALTAAIENVALRFPDVVINIPTIDISCSIS